MPNGPQQSLSLVAALKIGPGLAFCILDSFSSDLRNSR